MADKWNNTVKYMQIIVISVDPACVHTHELRSCSNRAPPAFQHTPSQANRHQIGLSFSLAALEAVRPFVWVHGITLRRCIGVNSSVRRPWDSIQVRSLILACKICF